MAGCRPRGGDWVAVERARHASDLEDRISHALRAVDIARRLHAGDLEIFALSMVGRARVQAGQIEDGLLLLEEAMAGVTGGQVANAHTLAEAYCNLILASTSAGDWVRANEWCQHVDGFARTHTAAPLFGTCRGVHADVLFATGHWVEAEQALDTSLVTLERCLPELAQPSVTSLAELRVGQDRLAEAEALLAGREEAPSALRVLALLRMTQHRPEAAVVLLERALHHTTGGVGGRARVLLTLVEAGGARRPLCSAAWPARWTRRPTGRSEAPARSAVARSSSPKTRSGVRTVHVPPPFLPMLQQHLLEHTAEGSNGLLFPGDRTDHMSIRDGHRFASPEGHAR